MASLFHRCRGLFRAGRWWLAVLLLVGLSGCKAWETQDDGLRDNGLSSVARQARPEKDDKDMNYLGLSDESREIERDLR